MKKKLCANCKKRPATLNWIGQGSIMDFAHGGSQRWCQTCADEAVDKYFMEKTMKTPVFKKWFAGLIEEIEGMMNDSTMVSISIEAKNYNQALSDIIAKLKKHVQT